MSTSPTPQAAAETATAVIQARAELGQLIGDEPISGTEHIYALVRLLREEISQPLADGGSIDQGLLADAIRTSALTLKDLVDDRDALMAAHDWRESSEALRITNELPYPEREQVLMLMGQLENAEPGGEITVPRDLALAAIAWFHTTQNFIVLEHAARNRADRYSYDAISAGASLSQINLERLTELAHAGVQITAADLEWAQQGLERLRGERPESEFTPPCMRDEK